MKRTLILAYGISGYLILAAVFLYAIGFIGNFGTTVSLDAEPLRPMHEALLINLGLLYLFVLEYRGMKRPRFRAGLKRIIPPAARRSSVVIINSMALAALMALWQPVGGLCWEITSDAGRTGLVTLYIFGWALVLVSSFFMNHLDLLGLTQVWAKFRDREYRRPRRCTPARYRLASQPLYLGWIIVAWAAPTMTLAHAIFAMVLTVYAVAAMQLDEKDLGYCQVEESAGRVRQIPAFSPRASRRFTASALSRGPEPGFPSS